MALNQFLFESGPDGAALSNGNSGSTASSLGGGTTTYAATMAAHGSFGARFENLSNASTYRRWPFGASTTNFQFSGILTYPGQPAQTIDVGAFVTTSGSRKLTVRIDITGQLRIVSASGVAYALVEAGDLSAGMKIRITTQAVGNSTTAASIYAKAYSESTPGIWDTPIGNTIAVTNADLGIESLVGFDAGVVSFASTPYVIGWDDLQLRDEIGGGEIPDYDSAGSAPVANTNGNQIVLPGTVVQLDGSSSLNTLTYAWTFLWPSSGAPVLTGPDTATPTFTAGAAGSIYAVQLQAINGGQSSTRTVNIAVSATQSAGASELTWSGSAWI